MKHFAHLTITLLLAAAGMASAQRYHVHTYSIAEGLPSANVTAVAQDVSGRMWFATRRGMVAYDGSTWEVHRPRGDRDDTSPSHVCADGDGGVWVVDDHGVLRHEGEGWSALPPVGHDAAVRGIASFGTAGRARLMLTHVDGRVHMWNGVRWHRAAGDRRVTSPVLAMTASAERAWIATEKEIFAVDPSAGTITPWSPEVPGRIRGIAHDERSTSLWILGDRWIARTAADARAAIEVVDAEPAISRFSSHIPYVAAADGVGGVYFGNEVAAFHYDPAAGFQKLVGRHGLVSGTMTAALTDRERNVWITSLRGISKVVSRRFSSYDREHGLLKDEVTAVAELTDGTIVLGHGGGLTLLGETTRTVSLSEDPHQGRVMDLEPAADGSLWIACEYLGLARMSPDGGIEWFDRRPDNTKTSVRIDTRGEVWVGTNRGLHKLRDGKLVPFGLDPEGPALLQTVRRLSLARDGSIMVSTHESGLVVIDAEGGLRRYRGEGGLNSVYSALMRPDGTIHVGTRRGLGVVRAGRIVPASPGVRRPVYALVEDAAGRLWIGTDDGYHRLDGTSLRHFDGEDGLLGLEANRSAAVLDGRGRLWLGNDRGVSVYHARLDHPPAHRPTIELTALVVANDRHGLEAPIELPQRAGAITFRFRATSFVDEHGVRFSTRLTGLEDEWSAPELSPRREIRYTNLPPGTYRFQIRAIDAEGQEGAVVTSAPITILGPWWARPWFIACAFLAVLVIILGVLMLWSQRRYARRLELEVTQRTEELRRVERRLAREARLDSLGVLAGGIAHDFNNLLTAIVGNVSLIDLKNPPPDELRKILDRVDAACDKAKALTDQLLTFSSGGAPVSEVTSPEGFLREAVSFALSGSRVRCRYEIESGLPAVRIDVDQLHQAIHAIVLNARDAMPDGGEIVVRAHARFSDGDSRVDLEIEDGGGGIPDEVLGNVFDPFFSTKPAASGLGLSIVHSVVKRHGGTVDVMSREGEGTRVRVTLPAVSSELASPGPPEPSHRLLRGRFLVMDDDAEVRAVARESLTALGATVEETADGRAAVATYAQALAAGRRFDAVLMDLTVPGGMGGVEATARILALDPDARVVVTSGYSTDAALADPAAHGFCGRIRKPFVPEDLARALVCALREAEERDRAERSGS